MNKDTALGKTGNGHGIHPWDGLNSCPDCGAKRAWLVGKDNTIFESGKPYKVICLDCGHESITSDNWHECIADWNKTT